VDPSKNPVVTCTDLFLVPYGPIGSELLIAWYSDRGHKKEEKDLSTELYKQRLDSWRKLRSFSKAFDEHLYHVFK
jgi:hypothetical protein